MPQGKPPMTEKEAITFLKSIGVEVDNEGFMTSGRTCDACGWSLWVKVTHKPAHWESDVTITTFHYRCRFCGTDWQEFDSD